MPVMMGHAVCISPKGRALWAVAARKLDSLWDISQIQVKMTHASSAAADSQECWLLQVDSVPIAMCDKCASTLQKYLLTRPLAF